MARKKAHNGRITGHGTGGHHTPEGAHVILYGEITDAADAGRPIAYKLSEAQARHWAAGLIRMADYIRGQRDGVAEPEPEPTELTGGLASLLGVAGKPAVDFTEVRPKVWKTATPEDAERLDATIDEALAGLGTSLAELREGDRDRTPTECQSEGCHRVRPRWTMARRVSASGDQWVCDPKLAMHCAVCCKPGESLTHYTEEEHQHG
jgi:hypothetical protein